LRSRIRSRIQFDPPVKQEAHATFTASAKAAVTLKK
jgi:hypothetical protein